MAGRYDRGSRRRSLPPHILVALVTLVLVAAVAMVLLNQADNSTVQYSTEEREREAQALDETVDVGGVRCVPKKNLKTYLFMGIDDTAEQGENYVMGGQCDTLILLVVDQTSKTYKQLSINRNTMCDVHSYDPDDWEDLGTTYVQIALAHSSGDGGPRSCENVVDAVSTYLYGIHIDNYIALNVEGIPTVNQLAGGVTVTIEDDFSAEDPSLVMGETIKLTDEQAYHYLRGRMSVGDGSNESRMRRQQTYLTAMREQVVDKAKADNSFASDAFDALSPYMVTDMNGKAFSRLVNALTDCESEGWVTITGTVGEDEFEFATFESDPESVRDAVIELFYRREDDE